MKNEKILPFANETKKLKDDFKKMIDKMPDEDFIDMVFYLMESEFEEEIEDELEIENFKNPFSGEMVNFKCPECKKVSAYQIEIVNEIYDATKKEPQVDCFHCESHSASPIYYKTPTGKIFKN